MQTPTSPSKANQKEVNEYLQKLKLKNHPLATGNTNSSNIPNKEIIFLAYNIAQRNNRFRSTDGNTTSNVYSKLTPPPPNQNLSKEQ